MIVTVVQLAFSAVLLFSPELVHFPGPYFDTHGRPAMHRRAMERWPGSTALYEMWNDPQLKKPGRMAILLGGAATHDPALIPIYLDGIRRKSQEIRQAAAYGYHDLIGDKLPNVTVGVSDMRAGVLGQQMNRMRISLERNS